MSTRVKIAIAAAIVAALVGLIVLDQRSASRPAEPGAAVPAEPAPGVSVEQTVSGALESVGRQMETQVRQAPPAPEPRPVPVEAAPPPPDPRPAPPVPASETYEVKEGDKLWTIAEKKYGDGNMYQLIAKANSIGDHARLRVGQKLVLPPKTSADTPAAAPPDTPAVENGRKTYVIQPGDTLIGLATRFFKKAKYAAQIFDANKDLLASADNLVVGTRIVIPEVAAEAEAPVVTGGGATPAAPGQKTYRVKPGDSLWKIAKTFSGGKAVTATMEKICEANPDKIRTTGTPLQVDWVLVIPD